MPHQPPSRDGTVLSLRVSSTDVECIDEIRVALRRLGLELTRHAAARAALRLGLTALQQDSTQGGAST